MGLVDDHHHRHGQPPDLGSHVDVPIHAERTCHIRAAAPHHAHAARAHATAPLAARSHAGHHAAGSHAARSHTTGSHTTGSHTTGSHATRTSSGVGGAYIPFLRLEAGEVRRHQLTAGIAVRRIGQRQHVDALN